jgi:hypothetical protein
MSLHLHIQGKCANFYVLVTKVIPLVNSITAAANLLKDSITTVSGCIDVAHTLLHGEDMMETKL